MHIEWGCRHNAADEDCNKCMIFGIIMECPYNCEWKNKEGKVDIDDLDKQREGNRADGRVCR